MVAKENTPETSTELTRPELVPLDIARDLKSIADVELYFRSEGIDASDGSEITDGFAKLDNKERLVSVPLLVVDWAYFNSNEYAGAEVATIRLMTQPGEKFRISDGSTGLYRQLKDIEARRIEVGHQHPTQDLYVRQGLRVSRYWISTATGMTMTQQQADETPTGEKKAAATYYFDL